MPNASITRILFVHHRSELGGAPTSLSFVVANLDRGRFEPHVYCPPGPAAQLLREAGATVHEGTVAGFTHIWASTYRGRRWLLLLRELARLPAHVVELGRVLRAQRFDIVHLNDSPLIPAAWLARRDGEPVVWHLRSAPPGQGKDLVSRAVRRALLRLGDAFIAINGDIARLWNVPAEVIPNAVALDRFHPGDAEAARAACELPPSRPVVSYFGFVYPSKGFREFISAAALMRERGVDATFLIVGGGVRGSAFFRTPLGRRARAARPRTRLRVRGARARAGARARRHVSLRAVHAATPPSCTARATSSSRRRRDRRSHGRCSRERRAASP